MNNFFSSHINKFILFLDCYYEFATINPKNIGIRRTYTITKNLDSLDSNNLPMNTNCIWYFLNKSYRTF